MKILLDTNVLLRAAQAAHLTNECISKFTLLKDERGIFAHWFTLVEDHAVLGKNAHDARLVAAMLRHGITRNFACDYNGAYEDDTTLPAANKHSCRPTHGLPCDLW